LSAPHAKPGLYGIFFSLKYRSGERRQGLTQQAFLLASITRRKMKWLNPAHACLASYVSSRCGRQMGPLS
jgi:hypothetical protein